MSLHDATTIADFRSALLRVNVLPNQQRRLRISKVRDVTQQFLSSGTEPFLEPVTALIVHVADGLVW